MRLFIALELPEDLLGALVEWRARAFEGRDDLRLLPRASLHVTLVFLGYLPAKEVDRIAQVAFAERSAPFELAATEVAGVPRGRPRLYALALDDSNGSLGLWQGRLSERLERERLYEPERRPFWPHVSLARLKRGRSPSEHRQDWAPPDLHAQLRASFAARRVTLFRSVLQRGGAVYEALSSIDLPRS